MAGMLLGTFLDLSDKWSSAFAQKRTHQRAVVQAVAGLCCVERKTITSVIQAKGTSQQDWSAEYRLHSRSPWKPEEIFATVLNEAHPLCGRKYVPVAFDDTKVRKSGRRIPGASLWVDPLGPKFRVQFLWGLRFLQASVLVPAYRKGGSAARGIPVAFTEVPSVKRPRRKASEEEHAAYRLAVRQNNLSTAFVAQLSLLRTQLDTTGAQSKVLIATVDGGFCNRTCMRAEVERTVILARARRDAKLCLPSQQPRRTYDTEKFTPESVRKSKDVAWKKAKVFHGKRYRTIRYKEVGPVLWQGGTGCRPVRLIVLAPTRYRPRKRTPQGYSRKRFYYREPGYLLCTDLSIPASVLIQHYFDRWQIEVNHKEEKDVLGVGEAQLRSEHSVSRQPAFTVASYSTLMLAGIKAYGQTRTKDYCQLPKWYKGAVRPTAQDLVRLLRQEISSMNVHQGAKTEGETILQAAIAAARRPKNVQT